LLPVRVEQVRPASGTQPEVVHFLDPRPREVNPDRRRQREVASGDNLGAEPACEILRQLLGYFVAALPDARPHVGPRRRVFHLPCGLPGYPRESPAPAGVDHPHLEPAHERHRYAVRHGHRETEVLLGGDERVGFPREAGPRHTHDFLPGDLAHPRRRPPADRFPDHREVFGDRLRVVTDLSGDVQGRIRRFRDASMPGEEPDLGPFRPGVRRDVDGAPGRLADAGKDAVLGLRYVLAHAWRLGYRRRRKAGMSRTSPS
jgi:hypothetical protein